MASASISEYAILSANVYEDARGDLNKTPLPPGWARTDYVSNATGGLFGFLSTGISMAAYKKTGSKEIVIAFKGTDFLSNNTAQTLNDLAADAAIGAGLPSSQIFLAAKFYQDIKKRNPDANITFTGHSLGAGLASVMSVWFDKQAVVFADAPFGLMAKNPLQWGYVGASLLANGYSDSDFADYITSVQPYAGRETNVTNYFVNGEVLDKNLNSYLPSVQGQKYSIQVGGGNQLDSFGVTLHSMVLHAALLVNNQFRGVTETLPNLLSAIFDEGLYARKPELDRQDFLAKLLNSEIAALSSGGVNGLLTRFGVDVSTLGGAGISKSNNDLNKALIATAIEDYALRLNDDVQTLFNSLNGPGTGFHFDLNVAVRDAGKSKALLVKAIENMTATEIERWRVSAGALASMNSFYVQSGPDALTATDAIGKSDVMIGGDGADSLQGNGGDDSLIGGGGADQLSGGNGQDTLIGGDGNDTLNGGLLDDFLVGGLGNDTYNIVSGEGNDIIVDRDGLGSVHYIMNGAIDTKLTGGQKVTNGSNNNLWQSTDGKVFYLKTGTELTISFKSDPSSKIYIRDFASGQLGITLEDAFLPTSPRTQISGTFTNDNSDLAGSGKEYQQTLAATEPNQEVLGGVGADRIIVSFDGDVARGGDGNDKLQNGDGDQELYGDEGNDVLVATGGDDKLYGGTGNDTLTGGADDDILDGGEGNDFLDGGLGADILIGGEGSDFIVGGGRFTGAYDAVKAVENTLDTLQIDFDGNIVRLPSLFGANGTGGNVDVSSANDAGNIIDAGAGNDIVYGGSGSDIVEGGSGEDLIIGMAGADTIRGGAGNDKLHGDGSPGLFTNGNVAGIGATTDPVAHTGDDIEGGDGDDFIAGDGGSDTLEGGRNNDVIYGDSDDLAETFHGNDFIDGGQGIDHIYGGAGDDTIFGGISDANTEDGDRDYLAGDKGNDTIDGENGNDVIFGGEGNDTLYGSEGDDEIAGDGGSAVSDQGGSDTIDGGDGADTIYGDGGKDAIFGGTGNDKIYGDAKSDVISGQVDGDDVIDGGAGDDDIAGQGGNDSISGGDGNDTLYGDDGADILWGDDGSDVLTGGNGDDSMFGGAGEGNQLFGGTGNDTLVSEGANDILSGGAGDDKLFASTAGSQLYGGAEKDLLYGNASTDYLDGGDGNDELSGDGGDDLLVGGKGDDKLDGGVGADQLFGGDGDDALDGGAGQGNYLDGGDGANTLISRGVGDTVIANKGDNIVYIESEGETNVVIDDAVVDGGTATIRISRVATRDQLSIEQVSDGGNVFVLSTADGRQINLRGGVNHAISFAIELDSGDRIALYELLDSAGPITYAGVADSGGFVVGGGGADNLTLGNFGGFVQAGKGNDTVSGGTGNDSLDGGRGADTLSGHAGDDEYSIDDVGDRVIEGFDEGIDTVYSTIDTTLSENVENLVLDSVEDRIGTGSELDNSITGGEGRNVLYGLGGRDTLIGGSQDDVLEGGQGDDQLFGLDGNDTYLFGSEGGVDTLSDWVGDNVIQFKQGINLQDIHSRFVNANGDITIDYAPGASVTVVGAENGGFSQIKLADGSTLSRSEFLATTLQNNLLVGTANNDGLVGGVGDDLLFGEAGDDDLSGAGGNDVMSGGDGVDILEGQAGSDLLSGGSGNDYLEGGEGNDTIESGTGNDVMAGGQGDDIYIVGSLSEGGDGAVTKLIIDEGGQNVLRFGDGISISDLSSVGSGNDVVVNIGNASNSITIAEGLDGTISNFQFANGTTLGYGDFLEQTLQGGDYLGTSSDDYLRGGRQADVLRGFEGNDVLVAGAGDDYLVGGEGADSLSGGDGDDVLEAGEDDDFLSGGNGTDQLSGGDGRDTLDGGSGNDLLSGEDGLDIYLLNAGAGQDVIEGESDINRIQLSAGTKFSDIRAQTSGLDVVVARTATGDSLTLKDYRAGGQTWTVETADGKKLSIDDLLGLGAASGGSYDSTDAKIARYREIFAERQLLSSGDGLSGMSLPDGRQVVTVIDKQGDRSDYNLQITRRTIENDSAEFVADGAEEYSRTVTYVGTTQSVSYTTETHTDTSIDPNVKIVEVRRYPVGEGDQSGGNDGVTIVKTVQGKPIVTTKTTTIRTPVVTSTDHYRYTISDKLTLDSVQGGGSDNTVLTSGAGKLIDTGAGNDSVVSTPNQENPGSASRNDSNTDRFGDFLYGNAGDDVLQGRDLRDEMIGGAGADTMDGGKGADIYRLFADEDGQDLVLDSGANPLRVNFHFECLVASEGLGRIWSRVFDIAEELPRTAEALSAVISIGLIEDPFRPGMYRLEMPDSRLYPDYLERIDRLPQQIVEKLAPFIPGLQDRFDQMVAEGQSQVLYDANGNIEAHFEIHADFASVVAEGLTLSEVEDVLSFEAGIDRSALVVNWTSVNNNGLDHAALEISWGGIGSVRVLAQQAGDPSGLGIEKFQFADGTSMSMSEMLALANWVPTLEAQLVDQSTAEGMEFEYVVPQGTFHDADVGQSLSLTATLADGQPLPSWLTFDAQAGKFSGLVPGNASGSLDVRVTATDFHGTKVSDVFSIGIADVNRAPAIGAAIDGIQVTQDETLSFTVPDGTFSDPDPDDVLTYSATLANGDPLPSWLSFDADTKTFSGTPGSGDVRDIDVSVIATDMGGQSVSQTLTIAVANVNDAPVVLNPIAEQTASENAQFEFAVPANAFQDADEGDVLTYEATLENGDLLPDWLTFDAGTKTFSGKPVAGDIGALVVKLTVQDAAGLSTSQSFRLNVTDVNQAPDTGGALPVQTVNEDAAFRYTLPSGTFTDADAGDSLVLTATLANGDALPSWLTFDAETQSFAGTPANGDVGQLDLVVTAVDAGGLSATQSLRVNVANVNDAPMAVGVIVAPGASENTNYSFVIPTGSFADVDTGDSLRFTATLANGDPLPSWLSLSTGLDGALRLNGVPPKSSPDSLEIVLTATDLAGAAVSSSFALAITHAPVDPGVVLTGTRRSDTLTGGSGSDSLSGGGGNDTLNGMGGSDTLNGDAGADVLNGGDDGDLLFGNGGIDALNGDAGNDELHGGLGGDVLNGGADDDLVFGDEGLDQLFGGSGNDYLNGGTGADSLEGGEGNDLLEGNQGVDVITDLQGNNLLAGNQGSDQLTGGNGNNVFIGGLTNDSIVSGSGNDLFAFNALDGDDHIRLGGGEDTLSLGGGIRYEDLSLMRQGDSLRLNLGNGDTITFDDWYTSPANQSLVNLQVIADSLGDYDASGTNVLKDNKVESFDFQALVTRFEEARAANPRLNRWSMMNSMLGAHLGGSDVAAMGGDLAYQFGHFGSLSNVSVDAAQAMLASAQLNVDPQALQAVAVLQTGGQRLT